MVNNILKIQNTKGGVWPIHPVTATSLDAFHLKMKRHIKFDFDWLTAPLTSQSSWQVLSPTNTWRELSFLDHISLLVPEPTAYSMPTLPHNSQRACGVCQRWRSLGNDTKLWDAVFPDTYQHALDQLRAIKPHMPLRQARLVLLNRAKHVESEEWKAWMEYRERVKASGACECRSWS